MLGLEERNVAEVKDGSMRLGFNNFSGKVNWACGIWGEYQKEWKNDKYLLSWKYLSFFKFPSQRTVLFQHFLMLDWICRASVHYKNVIRMLGTSKFCVIKVLLFLHFHLIVDLEKKPNTYNSLYTERNETETDLSVVTRVFWWCDLTEGWRQGDRRTSPRSHRYVPGKVGLLCPREGRGICCIANWWSLVNCRVGRKLELTNQTGLIQRSWQLQYTANLTFANITDGGIFLRTNSPFLWQSSENADYKSTNDNRISRSSLAFQSIHAATDR